MQERTSTASREPRNALNAQDRNRSGSSQDLATDIVLGALAGAVGVWAMDRVGWRMYLNEDPEAFRQEKEAQVEGKYVAHVAAGKLAEAAGLRITRGQQHRSGKVVHYLLGMLPGAAYGALRERMPAVATGRGMLYGFTLFAVQDEVVAPALGLARGPRQYPWQAHARGLVTHLIVGLTTDAVLNAANRVRRR